MATTQPDGRASGIVAAIGESLRVGPFAMAGALVAPADDRDSAIRAFRSLPDAVLVLVLTDTAAQWLRGELPERPGIVHVVMPGVSAGLP